MNRDLLEIPLQAKLDFLRRPDAYPERPRHVDLVETHMSCVFLGDAYVYKLKRPVRYDFLDFSTSEKRRIYCEEEVRLNRRLASDIYLGVMALTIAPDGELELGGDGPPIDWLVKMRRLPAGRMLDAVIRTQRLDHRDIKSVAIFLAKFYASAPPLTIDPASYWRRFADDIAENWRELIAYGLPGDVVDEVSDTLMRVLERERAMIESRARDRRVIEGHGDLRPEHVHLGPPPRIIDCLEFNRDFRILDPVDEISFLAMECDRLGGSAVGKEVLACYAATTGDRPPERLEFFYKGFRAALRAKIVIWHLREPDVREPNKWINLAQEYLELAKMYARHLGRVNA